HDHGDRGSPRHLHSGGDDCRGAHPRPALRQRAARRGRIMSLFAKFAPLAELRSQLARAGAVPSVATPMDAVHSATEAVIDGRQVLLAGTNNYLGLTFAPETRAAAIEAINTLGTGTTGSRMASGNYDGHRQLEQEFGAAFGYPPGIVFSTGYQANLGA